MNMHICKDLQAMLPKEGFKIVRDKSYKYATFIGFDTYVLAVKERK